MGGTSRRGFPTFWFGQAISQFGDEITMLALPWLLAETTASPLAVGALEAFSFLPVVFFGLVAGVVADRRSRRRSMLDADAARFLLFASIPIVGWLTGTFHIAHVLAVAFLVGTARILFEASAQSFLPDLVSDGSIVEANSKLSMTEGVAIVVGPTAAGLMVHAFGADTAVAIDALTFAASFVAIMSLRPVVERRAETHASVRADLVEGFRTIRSHRLVASATAIAGAANLASGMTAALMVFFLQRNLGVTGLQAGLIIGANGIGVLAAGVGGRSLVPRLGYGRSMILGHGLAALGIVLFASSKGPFEPLIAALGLSLLGFGVVVTIIANVSLRQVAIPGAILGRVTSTYRTVLNGAMALGALAGGVIGQFVGVRPALAVAGALYVVVTICASLSPLREPDPVGLGSG